MQRNFQIVRSRPCTPGNSVSPGQGAIVSCSGDGWVRLLLQNGNYLEIYCQAGITQVGDAHIRGVDTAAAFTPLATNVVANIYDLSQ